MRKSRILTIVFTGLMIGFSALMVSFMPEQVAIHFDINGVADGFSTRYAYLFIPALFFVVGAILVGLELMLSKTNNLKDNGAWSVFNAGLMAFFFLLSVLITVNGYIYGKPDAFVAPDFMFRIIMVAVGVFQVFLSHWLTMLPFIKPDDRVAVKISMQGKAATEEQHNNIMQYTKKTGIVLGCVISLSSLFLPMFPAIIALVALYVIWSIIISVHATRVVKSNEA